MIYLFTAFYEEAKAFIKRYGLRRADENTRFSHYCSETADIRLTVTGVGELAAAAAVSSICTTYPPKDHDFLINIGICAGVTEKEGIFLVHKLTERATGKTFYPDILYRHPFREGSLVTGMVPWNGRKEEAACFDGALYDMEAAAVYQAGAYFFGPHRMLFLKIVSDGGEPEKVSGKQTEALLGQKGIFEFLERLLSIKKEDRQAEKPIGQLCADLHCSKTMEASLRQYIRYLALAGVGYEPVIQKMYEENLLPSRDKKEGKRCFEELKRRLLWIE